MHLKARSIADEHIANALANIQSEVHDENLHELARRKWPSIKAKSDYERTAKLIQFLLRKGFAYDKIKKGLVQMQIDIDAINLR